LGFGSVFKAGRKPGLSAKRGSLEAPSETVKNKKSQAIRQVEAYPATELCRPSSAENDRVASERIPAGRLQKHSYIAQSHQSSYHDA